MKVQIGKTLKSAMIISALCCGTVFTSAQQGGGSSMPQQSPQQQPNTSGSMNGTGNGTGNTPGGMNSMPGMDGNNAASMQDRDFLKKAAQGGNFEIQAGQLALQKSNSADVKQFAQMMVDDHTKLNEQMKPVAAQAGVKPPAPDSLDKKAKAEMEKLQGLSGDAFDKEYIATMVKDHTEDSKEFKTEANNGQLPAEKTAAAQGGQVVDMHLQKVQELAKAHNVTPESGSM